MNNSGLPSFFRQGLAAALSLAALAGVGCHSNDEFEPTPPTPAHQPYVSPPPEPATPNSTQNPTPEPAEPTAARVVAGVANKPASASVLKIMRQAADWQLSHPSFGRKDDWIYGTFCIGVMALGNLTADAKYYDAMKEQGQNNSWQPGGQIYFADDHAITQMYLELYQVNVDPTMLLPTQQRFNLILDHPRDDNLDYARNDRNDKWSWCDSLFMDPPAWALLSKITGDARYLNSANQRWWATSNYLYDKDEHLYYRDSTFFLQHEPNEKNVFWARGNGWVMAGLARMMEFMPADYPDRAKYARQFVQMAEKIKSLQQPDGLWRSGLLDPADHPQQESSGTAFFAYAFAWGINHGVLDRATYEPVVYQAWDALTQCVQADGKLTHVQPVGAAPAKGFDENSTSPFGVGAFLLAGSEVYQLANSPTTNAPKTVEAIKPTGALKSMDDLDKPIVIPKAP